MARIVLQHMLNQNVNFTILLPNTHENYEIAAKALAKDSFVLVKCNSEEAKTAVTSYNNIPKRLTADLIAYCFAYLKVMGSAQSNDTQPEEQRTNTLQQYKANSQKEKTRQRFEKLLKEFVPDIQTATPQQISKFLFSMEKAGRTQYHMCPHAGSASPGHRIITTCQPNTCPDSRRCPHIPNSKVENKCTISSSPDSVKNTVSHLRAIFRKLGKHRRWQEGRSNTENPALSDEIDDHIKLKEQEATDALIQPLQATPIFKS
ncbi:hypothetical protein BDR26DRAFT_982072 [Obelidium mucronatum]|nr:hypothetical protein BDR26DRAFT_982072 [Obelidium mucronatum]